MSDPNGLTWAATLVSLAVAIPTAGHAVIYKRDPRSATLWVLLIALLPLGGSLLYGLFGINRYQRRARRLFPGADPAVRQDLSPTMQGKKGPEPKSQFIMHVSKKNASRGDKHPAPLFRGVTTGRYTYAVYPDRPWCLFDNHEDPYQMHNLITEPAKATIRKELRAMLAEWLTKAEDPFVIPGDEAVR